MRFCPACGVRLPHDAPVRCPGCARRHWQNPKPCAGAVVEDAGRILLVRRAHSPWRGCWDVPGGFCAVAEHPTQTAEREVREETGLAIRVTDLLGIWLDEYDETEGATGDTPEATLNVYYRAHLIGGRGVRLQVAEVSELGWFLPAELPPEIAFPRHIPALLDAWRRLPTTSRV
jgi:ADP-ribose pyrophosphatase YjhB (NUDIX family)